jgi:predicted small lipoprotein YifL
MRPMYKLKHLLLCALILAVVAACGQKGPLYLPPADTGATQGEIDSDEEGDDGP